MDITYTDQVVPGSCINTYTLTRTWKATDDCGNTTSCEQVIVVQDTTAPMFMAPGDLTIECGADIYEFAVVGEVTATDVVEACGIREISFTDDFTEIQNCFKLGYVEREWLVVDNCDNSSSATQRIYFDDLDCLPCPDTIVVFPGDTCLDEMTFELNNVERVEICDPGDKVDLIAGTDSCVTLTPNDPDFLWVGYFMHHFM